MFPPPNYANSKARLNAVSLTDGRRAAQDDIWFDPATAGWQTKKIAPLSPLVVLDLGEDTPIGRIIFSSAAGRAGVRPPGSIGVFVSGDKRSWTLAGDLTEWSRQKRPAPSDETFGHGEKATRFTFDADGLNLRGRYLALAVFGTPFVFCDEIEVYAGGEGFANAGGERIPGGLGGLTAYLETFRTGQGILNRVARDREALEAQIQAAQLSAAEKSTLLASLPPENGSRAEVSDPAEFSTRLPYPGAHRELLKTRAAFWRALGFSGVSAGKVHRFGFLDWNAVPQKSAGPVALEIALLGNEVRSDAFVLRNAGAEEVELLLSVEPAAEGVRVIPVAWTDTGHGIPVADALPEPERRDGAVVCRIPAGVEQKIWVTVDGRQFPPGERTMGIEAHGPEVSFSIPLTVRATPSPGEITPLSLGMFDYANGPGEYGLTPQNRRSAVELMRSHGVDTAWASSRILSKPQAEDFDAADKLTAPLDFSALEEWVRNEWAGARRYFVFANVQEQFAGRRAGTPEFDRRVKAWVVEINRAARQLGLNASSFGLLLVDEPKTEAANRLLAAWMKPIREAGPAFSIFADPTWPDPRQMPHPEAVTGADIISPNTSIYKAGGEEAERYYEERRAAGQRLEFYSCGGPARLACPTRYYRLVPWLAFLHGAEGISFWSFGDIGGAPSSWNDYLAVKTLAATPVFLSRERAENSIHWEAVREGLQDYKYLAFLRQNAPKEQVVALQERSRQLLKNLSEGDAHLHKELWMEDFSHQQLDDIRAEILRELEQLLNGRQKL